MAKLRDVVPDREPEESISSDGEEDVYEEESSEEEGESEEDRSAAQNGTQPNTPQKPSKQLSSSSEEGESDTGSDADSDSPSPKSDWGVKAHVSKPVADHPQKSSPSSKKPRSKTGPTGPTSPRKFAVEKRPAEKEIDTKKAKRPKKTTEGIENSEKKLFQRLWSEEDEIVILKGMTDYATKKKADPVADIGAFLEFIKKSLHVEVSKTQLQDKVRRLKKKFENNASKEREGKERTFSKPHEQTAYELSKKIWGKMLSENDGNVSKDNAIQALKAESGSGSVPRKSKSKTVAAVTPKKKEEEREDIEIGDNNEEGCLVRREAVVGEGSSDGLGSCLSVASWVMGDGMKMVGDSKREEMEEKWRHVKEKEVEVFLMKLELMCEQTGMVLEAIRRKPK